MRNKKKTKFKGLLGAYVKFNGIGGYQEKLIGKLIKEDIPLFDFSQTPNGLIGVINAVHYKYLKQLARQFGIRVTVAERQGMYYKLYNYRKRWGIITGALCCTLAIVILSQFVWDIEIIGNEAVSEAQISKVLNEYGVFPGVYGNSLNLNGCEYRLKTKLNNLSWVSVEREGSRIYVKVTENENKKKEDIPVEMPCNIISDVDGQLVSAIIKRGTFKVQTGDGIHKGELLVSGAVDNNLGGMIYLHSEADLIARCDEYKEFYLPFTRIMTVETDKKHYSEYFMLGNYAVPIPWKQSDSKELSDYTYNEETGYYSLFGIMTPLQYRKGIYTENEKRTVTYRTEDLVKQLEKQKTLYEENFYSNSTIISCQKEFVQDDNGITMKLKYTVEKPIGVKKQIRILY